MALVHFKSRDMDAFVAAIADSTPRDCFTWAGALAPIGAPTLVPKT
jgi:hypothetical protein